MYVDILILAHLTRQPYHGYELKRQVEQTLGDAFVINNNHLYPALKRFEEMGAISRRVERQSGRPDRHTYRISERGEEVLQGLLRDFPRDLARNSSEFMTRVAFFHLLDHGACIAILTTRREVLQEHLQHLEQSAAQVHKLPPHLNYAARILAFGQQQTQHELDWIDSLMQEIST